MLSSNCLTRAALIATISLAGAALASPAWADVIGTGTTTIDYSGSIVDYTVTTAGIYDIIAYGADGGDGYQSTGGQGAAIGGAFNLSAGTILNILVGQAGDNGGISSGGGGGGGGGGGFFSGDGHAFVNGQGGGFGGNAYTGSPAGDGGFSYYGRLWWRRERWRRRRQRRRRRLQRWRRRRHLRQRRRRVLSGGGCGGADLAEFAQQS